MHKLFALVLGKRDLSLAGDIFSLDDAEIEDGLSDALEQIKVIVSSPLYLRSDNDQAVVEICITRVTAALRETRSVERHAPSLASLWGACLERALTHAPRGDSPHAKVAADITSCVLQNYGRPAMMRVAVPVAVRFLRRGDAEVSRSMSSVIALAAMGQAPLLGQHVEAVADSVIAGNLALLRVLPQVYEVRPSPLDVRIPALLALLGRLTPSDTQHLHRLLLLVVRRRPEVLSECVPQLLPLLRMAEHSDIAFTLLGELAERAPALLVTSLAVAGAAASSAAAAAAPAEAPAVAAAAAAAGAAAAAERGPALPENPSADPPRGASGDTVRAAGGCVGGDGAEGADVEGRGLDRALREVLQASAWFPARTGQAARVLGVIGRTHQDRARQCLNHMVSLLSSTEHTSHHALLLEIKSITDKFGLLRIHGREVYRMSNGYAAIASLLAGQLERGAPEADRPPAFPGSERPLRVGQPSTAGEGSALPRDHGEGNPSAQERSEGGGESPQAQTRRYSCGEARREERRDLRFHRSKSLGLYALRSKTINSDDERNTEDDAESGPQAEAHADQSADKVDASGPSEEPVERSEAAPGASVEEQTDVVTAPPANQKADGSPALAEEKDTKHVDESHEGSNGSLPHHTARGDEEVENATDGRDTIVEVETVVEIEPQDGLYRYMKDNLKHIRAYCADVTKKIPVPERCVVEELASRCLFKLSFGCPKKSEYCLYSKSHFSLPSRQPQTWLHLMTLFLQSRSPSPLSVHDAVVRTLAQLWDRARQKGGLAFETAVIHLPLPSAKDVEFLRQQLGEVCFFDVFGFDEEAGRWGCYMCNHPDKALDVNQEGRPLMEGKLKEKQVRWKFIKRWRTRYFTLAGNQLLFRKGKSKDEGEECPLELSKVQSVRIVSRKRKERGLPRAFEIFTESRSYVLKACDERDAEEWLQCLNVAVARAHERQSQETTTYL
ncbi:ventricular zone-expressed PH domain-containing protein homolog 1 isoform X1 [Lethenteron reissneri]|uniref:ventricular zone-expressed PH domain-containing protein homolog 1 isoform X1 n=1 Tax=Lethenteron reissneri TaxID=7753 RepID=UPI002AB75E13|nr:ventricular zone-expressed PH domain-containing protein homolog 1 isoform X1 [Lethenteron reissneri]XP_061421928.1 ventricular zone-expressed PH domain-containing protein homolog 1 isoform X1 [Lethenteron reissneri]XP_061421929.1 ventricular zone-expressed PH domain-containing protein homolog 1 isoform X1 [Lethenteron reissneri]XP_061421930.1 ventricular zone-expressed PH domain-containing protein homolog 1 isoform X1 [Lethenteron reissneri]XP_061421931.1 ventricular zone-expressed PH domain